MWCVLPRWSSPAGGDGEQLPQLQPRDLSLQLPRHATRVCTHLPPRQMKLCYYCTGCFYFISFLHFFFYSVACASSSDRASPYACCSRIRTDFDRTIYTISRFLYTVRKVDLTVSRYTQPTPRRKVFTPMIVQELQRPRLQTQKQTLYFTRRDV